MSDPEHARMMMRLAQRDLMALTGMMDPEVFVPGIFGFHAQQAVEKAAKAWLSWVGVVYPRTHDIKTLFNLLGTHGATVPQAFLPLIDLTEYGVLLRYNESEGESDLLDRSATVREVTAFLQQVEKLLPEK